MAAQTKDKIQELIERGLLTPDTRLVLTNAIYFKARWQEEFHKANTADKPFSVAPDKTIQVPTMRQVHSFGYFEDRSLQAVELPYVMGRLSMVVLVPRQADGLAAVEKDLSSNLDAWLGGLKSRRVDISLPRFKTTCSFLLSRELTALGMTDAFSSSAADFSGMTGAEKLFISEVVHKAYVAVDEEGTEAAAATAVLMAGGAARPPTDPPVVVKADRPFLFLIRHNGTGSILFIGRVVSPLAAESKSAKRKRPRRSRVSPTPAPTSISWGWRAASTPRKRPPGWRPSTASRRSTFTRTSCTASRPRSLMNRLRDCAGNRASNISGTIPRPSCTPRRSDR